MNGLLITQRIILTLGAVMVLGAVFAIGKAIFYDDWRGW